MNSRHHPRPRHYVPPALGWVLWPAFRYSSTRDAHVLRVVGNRVGPVLRFLREPLA
jgi:hypothetical protein